MSKRKSVGRMPAAVVGAGHQFLSSDAFLDLATLVECEHEWIVECAACLDLPALAGVVDLDESKLGTDYDDDLEWVVRALADYLRANDSHGEVIGIVVASYPTWKAARNAKTLVETLEKVLAIAARRGVDH